MMKKKPTYEELEQRVRELERFESEFLKTTDLLKESDNRFRLLSQKIPIGEEELRILVEEMPVMMDVLDENANIIVWNKECERVTGYSAEEMIGNPHAMELLYPDESYRYKMITELEHTGLDFRDRVYTLTCKDGSEKTISWSNISGKVTIPGWYTWAVGVGVDITERNLIEKDRRLLQNRLESLWSIAQMTEAGSEELYDLALEEIQKLTRSQYSFLGFINDNEEDLVIHSWSKEAMNNCRVQNKPIHFPISKAGLWSQAVIDRKPFVWNDYRIDHDRRKGLPDGHVSIRNLLSVPILRKDNVIAVAVVANKDFDYTYQDVSQIQTFVSNIFLLIEKRISDDALKKSDERLNLALDAVSDAVWDWRVDTGEVYFSSRWYSMLGYEPYELPQAFETWRSLLHPDDLAGAEAKVIEHLKSAEPFEIEFRMRTKENQWRWILARGQTVEINDQGKAVRMLGTHVDITDRKRAEEALRESENQINSIFKSAFVGIGLSVNRKMIKVNNRLCEMTGYDETELIGQSARMLYPSDEEFEFVGREKYAQIADHGAGMVETRCRKKDGTIMDVLLSSTPVNPRNHLKGITFTVLDITDRKRAEEALRENKIWLEETTRIAHVGGWKIDLLGNTLEWTDETFRIHELPIGDPPNVSEAILFYHADDRPRVSEAVQRALENGEGFDFEARIITAKQNIIWVHAIGHPGLHEGRVVLLWGTVQNITEQKNQEKKIQRERNFLDKLLETSPVSITVVNTDGQISRANTFAEKTLGLTRSDIYKRRYDDPDWGFTDFEGNAWPDEKLPFQIVKRTGEPVSGIEHAIEWPDGKKVLLSINAAPFFDGNGSFNGMVAVMEDVTERKQAQQALQKSEKKYKQLVENISEVLYSIDEKGVVNYISPAVKRILGYESEDITGKFYWTLIHPKDRKRIQAKFQKGLSGKHSPEEYRLKTKSGEYRWVRSESTPTYENSLPSGFKGVFSDITEEKRLRRDLQQARKMESLGTLAGGIAHEFNNMLYIMIGNAELAIDDIPEGNPAANCIQEIRKAGLRAKDVVRKLLSVAQKTPVDRKPLHIETVVKESLDLLRKTIPATIRLKLDSTCTTGMILGDPTELNQILINLCTNAVHAMTEQTGVLEVNLESIKLDRQSAIDYENLKPGDYAKLTVRDSGAGIEPALIDRVFDPYFTTKEVDVGLGMGLAVVYGIVKNHDGAVKIESEVGNGTTVEVLFPLIEEQEVVPTEKTDTPPTGTERILFVDDEPSLVKMITQMLKRSGYEIVSKTSSPEALEAFIENPEGFDLVITDMAMPVMAGDKLAREIKRVRPNIPIILCTGHSDNIDENRAMELGINAFIMKPVGKADLTRTVRELLDGPKE